MEADTSTLQQTAVTVSQSVGGIRSLPITLSSVQTSNARSRWGHIRLHFI